MIKGIVNNIRNIDKKIITFMFKGFKISLLILLFSCYILSLYSTYPFSHISYLSGLNLLKLGINCFISFFICGFAINTLKRTQD